MRSEFTRGRILSPLLRFALPVLGALILQAMYGAVDLLVVGHFGSASDISAVSTGSQIMQTITQGITGLAIGTTILIGQNIGASGGQKNCSRIIGGGICLFTLVSLIITIGGPLFSNALCRLMQTPEEAFSQAVAYLAICTGGSLFIVAYNVLGSIFRGLGDSRTPLFSVVIACIANIFGDLLFVAVFHMAAAGAALATVLAQALSVVICVLVIRKRGLPFPFSKKDIRPFRDVVGRTFRLGFPIALQDLLVSVSFLVILSIVNSIDLTASAGMGIAQKLCAFIMLVPSAFSQSLSAFVAQNIGASEYVRARKAMLYGMGASLILDIIMAWAAFFHGNALALIFTQDAAVADAAHSYLSAYAIDTVLVSFLFCYIGYFNGCGCTRFNMAHALIGAFGVRIPVSYIMRHFVANVTLFKIGLATPCSTVLQLVLCTCYFLHLKKKQDCISSPTAV